MLNEAARTGLPGIGDVPWGSHFCQFYNTAEELADALVPFFKAGLEHNEQCVWVTSEPLGAEAARAALGAAMPALDERLRRGQIEIVDFDEFYAHGGAEQDVDAVLDDWIARKERALALGYAGLRASGNTCWIASREQWRTFADYEAKVNACFRDHRIVALCSYHLGRCSGADTIEVMRNHQFAISRESGTWNVVESARLKAAREQLRRANETLERRVAERTAALRERERRFRELLEALPAAFYTTDGAGRITYYNQAAVVLAGRTPTLGSDEWCVTWRLYWPDGTPMPHDQCPMAVALRENRPLRGEEAVAERPDGTRVPFLAYPTPLRDASGALVGAANMLVDITARKQAEQALRELTATLEKRIETAITEREAVQQQLAHAQRMEALGQLAGGIAHDFNNVLQAVQGGTALIERRPADADGVRRLARMVGEAAGRGAAVTRRLLAFSRQGDLRAEPIDTAELLADMREILSPTLGAGIEVRLKTAPGLPCLMADKGQLETVLVNLATNARDAMPEGGVLTLGAAAETLRHGDGPGHPANLGPGSYVSLSVTDSGAGMDAATLARVSEPFFTTKPRGKGTGLGLAMARGFAEQSGGGLHIASAQGRGTTVALWFPAAEGVAPRAETDGAADADACAGTRARLLLVDDDAIVRETVAEQLEAAGYAVLTADSGSAALALLDAGEAVDLVVSDLSMPGMGGVPLIRQAQQRRPGLHAILLTGFASKAAEIAVGGAVSGAFSLLRKPVDGRHLAERIAAMLEFTPSG